MSIQSCEHQDNDSVALIQFMRSNLFQQGREAAPNNVRWYFHIETFP